MSVLETVFGALKDPRAANAHHRLGDLIVLMIAASLCGATTATDMALFAELRRDALRPLMRYDRAPSHDTFSRLLRLLDPEAFAAAFARFAEGFSRAARLGGGPEAVALDGKALRRACEAGMQHAPPMTVSLFAHAAGITLAARAAGSGKSEVAAALEVVQLIDLTDRIVTADALHCHHEMAAALSGAGAQYVLALKKNRPAWHGEATALFESEPVETACTEGFAHGRQEWREAAVLPAPDAQTAGHAAYGRVVARRNGGEPATRYFLLSKVFDPAHLLDLVRGHWSIETSLHWILDVHLGEDASRARRDHAPANTALLKRLARNILQMADDPKVPISHRIRKCSWSNSYLVNAITHMQ